MDAAATAARIRPLKPHSAQEVWQSVQSWVREESLASEMFGPIKEHSTDGDDTRDWLTAVTGCTAEQLIVSWDPQTAVLVDCCVFCRYWDDFCYTASDDVLVFPVAGSWALLYHHEEMFSFGSRRDAGGC